MTPSPSLEVIATKGKTGAVRVSDCAKRKLNNYLIVISYEFAPIRRSLMKYSFREMPAADYRGVGQDDGNACSWPSENENSSSASLLGGQFNHLSTVAISSINFGSIASRNHYTFHFII